MFIFFITSCYHKLISFVFCIKHVLLQNKFRRETFYVVAGDYNQNVKEKFETNLEVERILVHPLYNVENHQFDVMMIKLKVEF